MFWYPNQYLGHWRKIEKSQKIIIFSCLRGKSGKIEVKDDFDPNQSISNTTRGCRICLLTIKSRPKPFQHVQGNLFWYPNQYFQPWRKFEKSSKIIIFGPPDTLLIGVNFFKNIKFCHFFRNFEISKWLEIFLARILRYNTLLYFK